MREKITKEVLIERSSKRNVDIFYMRRDTNKTLKAIGEEFGISRERVRQIALDTYKISVHPVIRKEIERRIF